MGVVGNVIPAKAGIQKLVPAEAGISLDPCSLLTACRDKFRRDDKKCIFHHTHDRHKTENVISFQMDNEINVHGRSNDLVKIQCYTTCHQVLNIRPIEGALLYGSENNATKISPSQDF